MQNVKLRLYVKEEIEVFEIIDVHSDTLIKRAFAPLGSSFVDYIYSDVWSAAELMSETRPLVKNLLISGRIQFAIDNHMSEEEFHYSQEVFDNINVKDICHQLSAIAESLITKNIFFYVYYMYIYDMLERYSTAPDDFHWDYISDRNCDVREFKNYIETFVYEFQAPNFNKKITTAEKIKSIMENNNDYCLRMRYPSIPKSDIDFYPEQKYDFKYFSNDNPVFSQVIYPKTIEEIVCFLIYHQSLSGTVYNTCKNCGKYFVVSGHKNTEYCDRIVDENNRTCRDVGAIVKYRSKKNDDPIFQVFNRAYNTKNARIRYGKITHDEFKVWSKNARKMRDKCKNGEISLEDLTAWLNSDAGFYNRVY